MVKIYIYKWLIWTVKIDKLIWTVKINKLLKYYNVFAPLVLLSTKKSASYHNSYRLNHNDLPISFSSSFFLY